MGWWILGIAIIAGLVWMSWFFSLSRRLERRAQGGGTGLDAEAAQVARDALQQIERGRAAAHDYRRPF